MGNALQCGAAVGRLPIGVRPNYSLRLCYKYIICAEKLSPCHRSTLLSWKQDRKLDLRLALSKGQVTQQSAITHYGKTSMKGFTDLSRASTESAEGVSVAENITP